MVETNSQLAQIPTYALAWTPHPPTHIRLLADDIGGQCAFWPQTLLQKHISCIVFSCVVCLLLPHTCPGVLLTMSYLEPVAFFLLPKAQAQEPHTTRPRLLTSSLSSD
jgi:hypothetical protein